MARITYVQTEVCANYTSTHASTNSIGRLHTRKFKHGQTIHAKNVCCDFYPQNVIYAYESCAYTCVRCTMYVHTYVYVNFDMNRLLDSSIMETRKRNSKMESGERQNEIGGRDPSFQVPYRIIIFKLCMKFSFMNLTPFVLPNFIAKANGTHNQRNPQVTAQIGRPKGNLCKQNQIQNSKIAKTTELS